MFLQMCAHALGIPCFTEMLGRDASVHLVPSEHPFQLGMQTLVTPKWDWASPGRDTRCGWQDTANADLSLCLDSPSQQLCAGEPAASGCCSSNQGLEITARCHCTKPTLALTPAGIISGPQCHPGIRNTALGSRVQTELGILFGLWTLFLFCFVVVCLRQFQSILCKEKCVLKNT